MKYSFVNRIMSKKNTSKNKNTKNSKNIPSQKSEQTNTFEVVDKNVTPVEAINSPQVSSTSPNSDVNLKQESKMKNSKNDKAKKTQSIFNSQQFRDRVNASLFAILGIILVAGFAYYLIPSWVNQTDEAKIQRERKDLEEKTRVDAETAKKKSETIKETLAAEQEILVFKDQSVLLKTNKGDIKVDLSYDTAPRTVENFVRLTYRKYYDGTAFHRMAKAPEFYVIQGGDPNGDGSGGETSTGDVLDDELWEVEPALDATGVVTNEPKLRTPSIVTDYDPATGTVMYPKGSIVMAKTSSPDSATSQFFLVLEDTKLEATYTAFGKVDEKGLEILKNILDTVNPPDVEGQEGIKDGKPDQEIKIESASLVVPNRK